MSDKKFKKMYGAFEPEGSLKNIPKGYDKDHPRGEWLKLKNFVVSHYFTDAEVKDKKFMKTVIDTYKTAKPLNDFLKEAIARNYCLSQSSK